MYPSPFTYHRPTNVEEAVTLLARYGDDAAPYAGGTELLLAMKMGFAQYDHLIDLKRLPALRRIEGDGEVLSLGALATHAEIAASPVVREFLPPLATLCNEIANARVRSTGTIGGNLCFAEPRADPPTLLAALDTRLCLLSPRGERHVPAGDFVTGALETVRAQDELLLRIEVPLPPTAIRYERVVFGHRTIAGAAAAVAAASTRIWLGCVALCPARLPETEALLATDTGAPDDAALSETLSHDIRALDIVDDEDASADYRRHLAKTVTLRAIARCREVMV
jgi:carbon-monoxide dehydrogenase medium subunit